MLKIAGKSRAENKLFLKGLPFIPKDNPLIPKNILALPLVPYGCEIPQIQGGLTWFCYFTGNRDTAISGYKIMSPSNAQTQIPTHMTAQTAQTLEARRYDLDWLRVLAFGLLIFYHIGMFYNTEGWHVKSLHASAFPEPAMWLSSPWRLSLLFLISGVALRFAVNKSAAGEFARRRFLRLFVPLVFGMLVIVTPQAYFELLSKGEINEGYLAFYERYLSFDQGFSVDVPTWNHLWYVVYMLVYTMLVLPLMPTIRSLAAALDTKRFERLMGGGRLFILPALIFIAYRFTTDSWFPRESHDLVNDWGAHARYFTYFMLGLLLAKNQAFWRVLASTWRIGAMAAVVLAVLLSVLWANWSWVESNKTVVWLARAMRPLYAWVLIAAFLGAAQAYLNRPGKWLSYLTVAIFPYYILHQTLIVLAGVYFTRLGLSGPVEFICVLLATVLGCILIYEFIVRRTILLRPLFGVPARAKPVRESFPAV